MLTTGSGFSAWVCVIDGIPPHVGVLVPVSWNALVWYNGVTLDELVKIRGVMPGAQVDQAAGVGPFAGEAVGGWILLGYGTLWLPVGYGKNDALRIWRTVPFMKLFIAHS
jgi:hypothetical protein